MPAPYGVRNTLEADGRLWRYQYVVVLAGILALIPAMLKPLAEFWLQTLPADPPQLDASSWLSTAVAANSSVLLHQT
jgi:hypothetical protein